MEAYLNPLDALVESDTDACGRDDRRGNRKRRLSVDADQRGDPTADRSSVSGVGDTGRGTEGKNRQKWGVSWKS